MENRPAVPIAQCIENSEPHETLAPRRARGWRPSVFRVMPGPASLVDRLAQRLTGGSVYDARGIRTVRK